MIELFEGVPGSGKTHHLIAERFLPWVKAGRRIFIYCRGIYTDRLSVLLGIPKADLVRQITVWPWGQAAVVLALHAHVEPESAVIIDEAQTIFRSQAKLDPTLLRWLETHRHYGVDVVLTCQDYHQLTAPVTRLVEVTTKFVRLSFVGLGQRYQGRVRGNPEEQEVIRTFTGKYDPSTWAFSESYAGKVKERREARHTVWKSAKMMTAVAAGALAVGIFWVRPFGSAAERQTPSSPHVRVSQGAEPVRRPVESEPPAEAGVAEEPILIQGASSGTASGSGGICWPPGSD